MKPKALDAALVALYVLLWGGGVLSHFLWQRTPPDAPWTAPAFLACAAALLLSGRTGGRLWLGLGGAAGFAIEIIGVRAGVPFGRYAYGTALRPSLAGVTVVMACAWMILLAYVKSGLQGLAPARYAAALAGAVWMTAIDTVIEPVATAALGYWHWRDSGPYYGVPLSNFAGWLGTSALLLAAGTRVRLESRRARPIGLSVVVFFGLIASAHRMAAPAAIALGLCVLDFGLRRLQLRSE
jgi:putative membrane protein